VFCFDKKGGHQSRQTAIPNLKTIAANMKKRIEKR
jgi:hypothetical protein